MVPIIARQEALLMTVGSAAEPIVHSILSCVPKYLALVCSHDSVSTASKVKDTVEQALQAADHPYVKFFVVNNPADLVDCHTKVSEALAFMRREFGLEIKQIKIDYTGGTKTMSAAAVLAAAPDGYEFIYVSGSERTKGGVGVVVTGTEKIVHPPNPWVVLEEPTIRRILLYSNNGQWMAALSAVDELKVRSDKSRSHLFGSLRQVLDGLREWDRFNHEKACEQWKTQTAEPAPAELSKLAAVAQQSLLEEFGKKCRTMIGRLAALSNATTKLKRGDTDQLVLDMLCNAGRSAKRGDNDYAALLVYRAVELFAERRLELIHGVNNSCVIPSSVPEPLRTDLSRKFGDPGKDGWKLGLFDSARLLKELGDQAVGPLIEQLQNKTIDTSARNLSWLIHGNQHVTEKQFQSFWQSALKALAITDQQIVPWPGFSP